MTKILTLILALVLPAIANANPFVVHDGKSAYVIHRAEDSPESVKEAAQELQRVLRESTGCTLPIKTQPALPMICVGDCPAARAAGISGKSMADESFRIATIGENLYIVGRDTPDGQRTQLGGISHGTRHGVYLFLERVIGARWIMPNLLGEIIPRHDSLHLPNLDITDGPAFAYRALEIAAPPQVRLWAQRNRIGVRQDGESGSLEMHFGHSWNELMPEELREAHPEWAAEHPRPETSNFKFCTRQPKAVAAFARNLIAQFENKHAPFMLAASPSDGQKYCQCKRCLPHWEKDPHGMESTTPNILHYYNEVARIVDREKPGHMIGGIVYGKNSYPPNEAMKIEPNVFLCWAPLNV